MLSGCVCLPETNKGWIRIRKRRRHGESVNIIYVRTSITLGSFLKTYGGVWLGWAYGILKEREAVRQEMDEEMHGLTHGKLSVASRYSITMCYTVRNLKQECIV